MGELPGELQLDVKATGFKLFFLSMRKGMKELVVDFSSLKKMRDNVYSFSPSSNNYLGRIMNADVEVVRVKPDSLYFTFNNSYYKSVPIRPDVMIDFEPVYSLSSNIKTNPASVVLSGDSNIVKKIDSITTEKVILNRLDKSVKQKVGLVFPEEFGTKLFASVTEVQVEVNVDKFTDSEVEIPIEVLNLPEGSKIKTFPEKVKVKFQVGMNDYESIRPSMFRAVIDLKNADPKKNYMKIELAKQPGNIRNIRLYPDKVEFLIKK